MMQQFATLLIGLGALLYAASRFAPVALRERWRAAIRSHAPFGLADLPQEPTSGIRATTGSAGCSMGCSGCSSGAPQSRKTRFAAIPIVLEDQRGSAGNCGQFRNGNL